MDSNDIEKRLASDPGDPVFVLVAKALVEQGEIFQSYEILLAGLSSNPDCHEGRLVLAKLYFEQDFLPFCVKELRYIAEKLPNNKSVRRLLGKFGSDSNSLDNLSEKVDDLKASDSSDTLSGSEETVAEMELGFDDIDLLDESE